MTLASDMRAALIALVFALPGASLAKDYGAHGALFPVEEQSFLEVIFDRLADMESNGELAALQQDMQDTARKRIKRPLPVHGIGVAETYRMFEVDLSITLERDLSDHNGVVFVRAGTVINPLDHSRFQQRLVFIDGDDLDQVRFAVDLADSEPTKIILINGAPLDLTEQHGHLFYFDQGGTITTRLHIAAVPSVVSRGYPNMIVEEIPARPPEEDQ